MDEANEHDLAGTVGTDIGRSALLQEIVAKVGAPNPHASDEDIDLWWGTVEIDRLASGLTLATSSRLAEQNGEGEPAGPWVSKSDNTSDAPTELTPQGREAARRSVAETSPEIRA